MDFCPCRLFLSLQTVQTLMKCHLKCQRVEVVESCSRQPNFGHLSVTNPPSLGVPGHQAQLYSSTLVILDLHSLLGRKTRLEVKAPKFPLE